MELNEAKKKTESEQYLIAENKRLKQKLTASESNVKMLREALEFIAKNKEKGCWYCVCNNRKSKEALSKLNTEQTKCVDRDPNGYFKDVKKG